MTKGHSFSLNSTQKPNKNGDSTEEFYEYQVGGTWKGPSIQPFPKTSQSFTVCWRSGGPEAKNVSGLVFSDFGIR